MAARSAAGPKGGAKDLRFWIHCIRRAPPPVQGWNSATAWAPPLAHISPSIPAFRHRRSCWRTLFLGAALVAAAAHGAGRYDGVAYGPTGSVVYRETHWRYAAGAEQRRLVLYRCPDGRPFARKLMRWQDANESAPDFDFIDQRSGYREGLASRPGGRDVYWQLSGSSTEKREQVQLGPDVVVDAGFDSFVRGRWDQLVAGGLVRTTFLLPAFFEAVPVVIRRADDVEAEPSTLTFTIELDRWYRFAVPVLSLTYDRASRRLRQFHGPVTIRDARGGRQRLRVEFPDGAAKEVADDDVAGAAVEPLIRHCHEE